MNPDTQNPTPESAVLSSETLHISVPKQLPVVDDAYFRNGGKIEPYVHSDTANLQVTITAEY